MYFRQFRLSNTNALMFIYWARNSDLHNGGSTIATESKWDYEISSNKTNFRLQLFY